MFSPKCTPIIILSAVNIILWMCLVYVSLHKFSIHENNPSPSVIIPLPPKHYSSDKKLKSSRLRFGEGDDKKIIIQKEKGYVNQHDKHEHEPSNPIVPFNGVAATLMLNNPKWFQRRYTIMIQNVLFNLPLDWGIQIFYTGTGQSQFGLEIISPGLTRLIQQFPDRIILTKIPADLLKANPKPKQLWTTEWIWENMLLSQDSNSTKENSFQQNNGGYGKDNQNVLTFTGNGAICSNSKTTLQQLIDTNLDYIGVPWTRFQGQGGDGSTHSLRNRNSMLNAIRHQKATGKGYDGDEREDMFFIRALMDMNENNSKQPKINNIGGGRAYRIATKEQTQIFGGISPTMTNMKADEWTNSTMKAEAENAGPPFVISGTIPQLGNAAREMMLDLCPELKVIFPSLHNPSCFGAHPNGDKCAESICALKKDRIGGC